MAQETPSPAPSGEAGSRGELTVDQWGQQLYPPTATGRPHAEAWKHAAAAALHRWQLYAHDKDRALRLSRADYEGAIRAACEPDNTGRYEPHAPAYYEGPK